jgi:hypothetical protein
MLKVTLTGTGWTLAQNRHNPGVQSQSFHHVSLPAMGADDFFDRACHDKNLYAGFV